MKRLILSVAAAAAAVPAVALAAQQSEEPPRRPELFEALVSCRAVTEDAARLRCFDEAAANLQAATERRDVVVVDRAQVRESRRRLFGLALPRLPIFGGNADEEDEEEVASIDSQVVSARQDGSGRWVVTLEDGSIWAQVDDNMLALRPRQGQPVRVNRGALGSYMMRVNNQPGIRVRRQM
ncbi:hypothetical protein [Sphingosinicella terrae]|uniref:hypothetical protein n=1 Tax=Sphingosinicella terrae TaxID=2172047 RepID=UPI000E0D38A9|nr:hypothetical protein [Sphingosinicella terrae]